MQIDVGESVHVEVQFKQTRFPGLVQGGRYEVRALGWWMGVWEKTKEVILAEQGKEGKMAAEMMMGGFESEPEVVVFVGGEVCIPFL